MVRIPESIEANGDGHLNKRMQRNPDVSLLRQALAHHQAGRLTEAESMYARLGDQPDALNLRGLIAYQMGRIDDALALIGKAIRISPVHAVFHFNLALAHSARGDIDAAETSYRSAIALQADYADAHNNLGLILLHAKRANEARECFERAIASRSDFADARNNLGQAFESLGDIDRATSAYREAIRHVPHHVEALFNLGVLCKAQPEEAAELYRRVLALRPDIPEAHNNLGAALQELGDWETSAAYIRHAIKLKPDYDEAHFNLGLVHKHCGCNDDAAASYLRAIELRPDHARALNNLGNLHVGRGRLDQAIECFRAALHANPQYAIAHSNLLFCLNYDSGTSPQDLFRAYRDWNDRHAARLAPLSNSTADNPDSEKRLRVGYVSPDFNAHPVAAFFTPLAEHRDRERFEVFCYYSNSVHDAQTEHIRTICERWVECKSMSDAQLAQRIRDDRIDVLVDLAGHTAGNRLLAFALRPAPVQVSWLGYGYTTGLDAIDYFIGDPVFTPAEMNPLFSESICRLPATSWTYLPPADAPEPGALPAERNGYPTFGCLSRSVRLNAGVLDTWAAILHRLPDARLRLDSRDCKDPVFRQHMEDEFSKRGVASARLDIRYTHPVWDVYADVDIVLDCFPHNSGTTTFEALWMGVPVVTLAGNLPVGRIGASVLSSIKRTEWIANDRDTYVQLACNLASDRAGLAATRASLRPTVVSSPLLNHEGFARAMEAAYRTMWRAYCRTHDQQSDDNGRAR